MEDIRLADARFAALMWFLGAGFVLAYVWLME